jgi:23S rRNA (adenine-N6)-dimethyltransferase
VYGQNFFKSAVNAEAFASQLALPSSARYIVEIGPGSGRVTVPLSRLGRPVVAVEIDKLWHRRLQERQLPNVTIVNADFLAWGPPDDPIVAVGNLPFGAGTSILRHCLEFGPECLLGGLFLMQAEYVAKRTGRYGGNLFNAQWWPWYEFQIGIKFPRFAFDPIPQADTATLIVHGLQRTELVWAERLDYQDFVSAVFNTGSAQVGEAIRRVWRHANRRWLSNAGVPTVTPVKHLTGNEWISLYLTQPT